MALDQTLLALQQENWLESSLTQACLHYFA
jgi:hypothetical protein